jgi:trk system potassium uptake protein TrkA
VFNLGKLSVLIAGGGGTVELLLRDQAISGLVDQVIVIEREPRRRLALEKLGDILIIEGNASDTSIYENLNMGEIDAVLALTNRDEVNFLVLSIAYQYNVPIRIGVFRDPKIAEIARKLKLGIPIVKPAITAGIIKQVISSLTTPLVLTQLPLGEYKLYAVTISDDDLAVDNTIGDLHLEEDDAHPLLVHNGKELIPVDRDVKLASGNILYVLAKDEKFLSKIKAITLGTP